MSSDLTKDSYPYLTGMSLRNRSHLVFDEFRQDKPDCITQDGQVVFIKTDYVKQFFSYVMPFIKNKVAIVTHNSALGVDSKYLDFLNNTKVTKWYAQNANFFHEKLISVPLGVANHRWPHGDVELIRNVSKKSSEKSHLVYMNFDINTNKTSRSAVYDIFRNKDYVRKGQKKPFKDYLEDLSSSKYCISPPGAGIDCHRIWESIAVGTIPIVERCHNISFHSKMPIMIIDDWTEVTKEELNHKYDFYTSVMYDKSPIYMDYWIEKIGLNKNVIK
jgi:hypothetical protein